MTIEEKAKKVEDAMNILLGEIKDAKVVKAITEFMTTAEAKSKALLHDIIRDVA